VSVWQTDSVSLNIADKTFKENNLINNF